MNLIYQLKSLCFLLEIRELDELSLAQSIWADSSSNSKSYRGSKFRQETSSVFLGRNATDFNLPDCKLEHELKDSIYVASAFFVDPTFPPGEWSQFWLNFSELRFSREHIASLRSTFS